MLSTCKSFSSTSHSPGDEMISLTIHSVLYNIASSLSKRTVFREPNMQLTSSTVALGLLATCLPEVLGTCVCSHNNDAGRWKDVNSPAGAVAILVSRNGGQYNANGQGHMAIHFTNINDNIKGCISATAANEQSYHRDWFLWTVIHCEDSGGVADLSIWA